MGLVFPNNPSLQVRPFELAVVLTTKSIKSLSPYSLLLYHLIYGRWSVFDWHRWCEWVLLYGTPVGMRKITSTCHNLDRQTDRQAGDMVRVTEHLYINMDLGDRKSVV